MNNERKQQQFEFRSLLAALNGMGIAAIFSSRFVPLDRQAELSFLLAKINLEARENYRQYQMSYGSKRLIHPSMTKAELERERLRYRPEPRT